MSTERREAIDEWKNSDEEVNRSFLMLYQILRWYYKETEIGEAYSTREPDKVF